MKPVTPLRRSERLRRPTSKAIGSSPGSSPGTAAYVGRSINSRSRVLPVQGGQTDSDSTLRNTTSSKSSGSCTEDTVSDATDYMALVASFPPKLYETYDRLAPILRHSDAELMKRVSLLPCSSQRPTRPHSFPRSLQPCAAQNIPYLQAYLKEINAFLRSVIAVGFSCQWPEFNKFMELCQRIAKVIDAKSATLPPKMQIKHEEIGFMGMGNGLEFAVGSDWVAMSGEHWQEAWKDTADPEYLRRMYRNAAPPSNISWNDVGAGGSEVQSEETDALGYTLSYPQARSLDYCTIPDTY